MRRSLNPAAGRPSAAPDDNFRALGASIARLARKRVPTAQERDEEWRTYAANQRESRSTGRPAPVGDPSKAGAQMGGAAFSVPLFSPGPSAAKRLRDSLTWKENALPMARMEARLDSVQLARREDSAAARPATSDSVRTDDSSRQNQPSRTRRTP
jgi:hypothetical protein